MAVHSDVPWRCLHILVPLTSIIGWARAAFLSIGRSERQYTEGGDFVQSFSLPLELLMRGGA